MEDTDELKYEVCEGSKIQYLRKGFSEFGILNSEEPTMVMTMPNLFSLRVQNAAMRRTSIVIGMAAMVRPNSGSSVFKRITTNWIVNPRKKKKSNLRRVI